MGNKCVSGCSSPYKMKPTHSLLPVDIDNYKPENLNYELPKIIFEGQIFNIKMINCPQGTYSLNFSISDAISITLPQKTVEKIDQNKIQKNLKQLQWKLHQKFGFALTSYQLRSKFLIIEIFGQKKIKINEIVVNLYMIATGPQHHDLQIKIGKNSFSRLKFDFKISQVVQVNINIDQIKIQFDQDLEGQQFDYSFKIIRNNQIVAYSESSNPKIIKSPAEKNLYRQPTLDDECKSPLKFRKTSSSNKMIKRDLKSFAEWGEGDSLVSNLMNIKVKLFSNDINKSFCYFLVWKFSGTQRANHSNKDDWNLYAGALINFSKLFQKPKQQKQIIVTEQTEQNIQPTQKIGFEVQQRTIVIEQPLWGEDGSSFIGKSIIKLKMENPKFQRQMQACARTQDGIVNMTYLFKNYVGKNTRLQNKNISKIMQKYIQIEQLMRKLTGLVPDNYNTRSQVLMMQQQSYQLFQQICSIIKSSLNQSFVIVSTSNQEQVKSLIEDQLLLIQLINKLYYNIEDNTIYAGICWEIVLLVMKRGEFYLENIGFVAFDKQNKFLYQKKINAALKYQQALYKYFLVAAKSQMSNVRNFVISSVGAFKAYCYIKIPLFREKIIDSIQKAYDQDIVQFKLQQLQTVTSEMSSRLRNDKERSIINLDWDKYFHDQIRGNPQNASLERQVQDQIQNCHWIHEISKRQEAFFNFTAQLVKRLNQLTMRVKTWKWNYFPGYTKIVRGFMVEMKKRKIMDYPNVMIKTSSELLANGQLINVLMPIIVQKTNSFSKPQVIRCITMLQSFFNALSENQTKQLPRTLNYLYFFKTFKLIVETIQHNEIIIRALVLIYDFYEWLSPEWRDNITMYLLGKVFFKLFFHWSYQIRIIFYNFLIIKVKYLRIQQMPKMSANTQSILMNNKIQERYEQISTILLNAQNQKKQDILDYRIVYQKDAYKKMKKKLRKKKQSQNQGTNLKNQDQFNSSQKLKQNLSKKNQRYSLQSLLIQRTSIRKKSAPEEQVRNRSSTQFNFQNMEKNLSSKEQQLSIVRGSSFFDTDKMENSRKFSTDVTLNESKKDRQQKQDDENSLDEILDLKVHKGPRQTIYRSGKLKLDLNGFNKKLNYNIYNRQDHQLLQLSSTEICYIGKGIQEYRDTLISINKYYQKKGELPKRQLEIEPVISDQV